MIGRLRFALVITLAALWTLLLLPFQLIGLAAVPWLARHVPVLYHKGLCHLFGVRVSVDGAMARVRPLMLVSNHVSWLDIVVLSSVAPVSFVAKSEMKGWPIFGQLAQLQRTVFVARERRRTVGDQASEISMRLADDDVMVLFPEGTTGDGHGLYPFKTPLFEAARFALVEMKLDESFIQPVAIDYNRLHGIAMGRQWKPRVAWPGEIGLGESFIPLVSRGALDVTVRFAQPIRLTADSRRKEIAAASESAIRAMVAGHALDRARDSDV